MLVFLALFGSLFLLTQYLQSVQGFTPLEAGALVVPQATVVMIAAPLSSGRVQRYGNKRVVGVGMSVAALGTLGYVLFRIDSPVWLVIAVTMVIGLGMGNVMAPATDSIMGSLPRAKAGVGSAMNDTTRQTGGAIGVAVLGSVMASRFHSLIAGAPALAHLPASLAAQVRSGIGGAITAAQSPQAGTHAAAIESAAKGAFMSGFHLAGVIASAIVFCAAVAVFLWLPARETINVPVPVPAPAADAALAFDA
jgi:Na+/melibiose symporter-like transporter